jgi:hypothetical protein
MWRENERMKMFNDACAMSYYCMLSVSPRLHCLKVLEAGIIEVATFVISLVLLVGFFYVT